MYSLMITSSTHLFYIVEEVIISEYTKIHSLKRLRSRKSIPTNSLVTTNYRKLIRATVLGLAQFAEANSRKKSKNKFAKINSSKNFFP